ncbi:winged helix-turn-helix domain-containing protein [Peribacillus sp. AS_2]|uniref:winged helix-turn-helix domain-containing protein n=1 Tax=Peribacillus sp. AS_2 TaxID=2996755 RepID=UPI0022A69250|nr:winged helix-turn-helix domain-containing protein [Peribacillus sp. AS_2]MCZ0875627.1 winged helix-turn-helix domain-containing protein [Peribacillus sp. AS_2]
MEIRKILIPNIKERQMNYFHFDDMPYFEVIGNQNEFYKDIYRTYLKGQEKAFLVNKDKTKSFSCRKIEKFLTVQKKFPYFTPSIYWHHQKRTKEHLLWITQITLEFDLTKDGTNRKYSPFQLFQVIRAEFGFGVNYIWETKTPGHYATSFLIEPMTGTTQSIYLFEAIARRMAILVGADYTAISANNLYTKPKNGIWKFTDEVYNIDDFKIMLEDEEVNELVEMQYQEKVTSITEKRIWNDPAIQLLTSAEFGQYRNHGAFTIALLFYALGYEAEDAHDFFYQKQEDGHSWWEKVNSNHLSSGGYFPKREIKDSVKSAFSGKYHGPSREWIYMLTGETFPFNLYKSSYIKKEDGYLAGSETRRRIIEFIKEHNGIIIKQEELAQKLDVAYSSLKKELNTLKKEKVIDWQSQKGRYAKGSTFYYTYEDKHGFTAELDVSYREEGLVDYFSKKMS